MLLGEAQATRKEPIRHGPQGGSALHQWSLFALLARQTPPQTQRLPFRGPRHNRPPRSTHRPRKRRAPRGGAAVCLRRPPPGRRLRRDKGPLSFGRLSAPATGRFVERSLPRPRSEEHTSELQSRQYLVCRLLLEKKKKKTNK